jgi:hypothetical protein
VLGPAIRGSSTAAPEGDLYDDQEASHRICGDDPFDERLPGLNACGDGTAD